MPKIYTGRNVVAEAVRRMQVIFEEGHRVTLSFSAGKDSGVCLEICLMAKKEAERTLRRALPPLDIVMADDEIMLPGTFEYAERVAERPGVNFKWVVLGEPLVNIWNRDNPYWWVFDKRFESKWVRPWPRLAESSDEDDIKQINGTARFPAPPGKMLCGVMGLRVNESPNRRKGLWSSMGYLAEAESPKTGERTLSARPIYDWTDDDVWKAHKEFGWDYNRAYDMMVRLEVPKKNMRIAPPTLVLAGHHSLNMAMRAWPQWFDRVAERCPGVRLGATFGPRAVLPHRRPGETWKDVYQRFNIDDAPKWIAERCEYAREKALRVHAGHSRVPFPDIGRCKHCNPGSWEGLSMALWNGDPFVMSVPRTLLPYVDPQVFRPELKGTRKGTWVEGATPHFPG